MGRTKIALLGIVLVAIVGVVVGNSYLSAAGTSSSKKSSRVDLPEVFQSAAPIDLTFADIDGIPFCDGVQLTLNETNVSVFGVQTGCVTGLAFGAVNVSLLPQGVGAGLGYSGDFVGLYTQLTFSPAFWIHYDEFGGIINFGQLLFQTPPPTAVGGGVSSIDVD